MIIKVVLKLFVILIVYSYLASLFRPTLHKAKQFKGGPQHMLLQDIPNAQFKLLLNQNQNSKPPLLFSSNSPYLVLVKKFIAQHFKEIQPITNAVIETLEKIFPQAWLSGILGMIYFIFTFTFGGGFSYFNRNIKELSNHQAKIERGIDLRQTFIDKSQSIKHKQHILLQQLNLKPFNKMTDFLTKDAKQIKIIQSTKRQDISDIILSYLRKGQTSKFNVTYLNLQVIPFNHQSNTKNLHIHILDDIIYGMLFSKDRGVSLALFKTAIKIIKESFNKICTILVAQWINLSRLAYLLGVAIGYMFNPQVCVLFIVFKMLHLASLYLSRSEVVSQSKVIQKRYLIIDKFELIKEELMNKNQMFIEDNLLVFSQVIANIINLAKTADEQIILIVQEPLFFQLVIKKVCSLNKLKLFTNYRVQQLDYQDAQYLSKYLKQDCSILQKTLQWCNDFHEIKMVASSAKSQFQMFDDICQANIRKIDEIVIDNPKLKEELSLFLNFIMGQTLTQLEKKNQIRIKSINEELLTYIKKYIGNVSRTLSKEKSERHINELKLIAEGYPSNRLRFYSLRQRYFIFKQKQNKQEGGQCEKIYQQVYNLLNKKYVLQQHEFYSKTICISIYLWCNKLF